MFIQWTTSSIGGVIVGFIYDWRLALVMLGATPFVIAATVLLVWVGCITIGSHMYYLLF